METRVFSLPLTAARTTLLFASDDGGAGGINPGSECTIVHFDLLELRVLESGINSAFSLIQLS